DAFALTLPGQSLDALTAAQRAFGSSPRWIRVLLKARNILVAPFGLKAGEMEITTSPTTIGIFPLLQQSPDQIVMGLNDRHLDFRLRVDVAQVGPHHQSVTATTAVKTHNRLGRAYLATILPFHRIIVRTMLAQISRA
ncbi:MAG: DUF2867 domain-containing protein, partial [Paracoccaceae bacterium]